MIPGTVELTFPWDAPEMAQAAAVTLGMRGYSVRTTMEPIGATLQQWRVVAMSPTCGRCGENHHVEEECA